MIGFDSDIEDVALLLVRTLDESSVVDDADGFICTVDRGNFVVGGMEGMTLVYEEVVNTDAEVDVDAVLMVEETAVVEVDVEAEGFETGFDGAAGALDVSVVLVKTCLTATS